MATTAYRHGLVEWMNEGTTWTHFITLTSRFPSKDLSLSREVGRFIRRLEQSTQGPVYHLWVIEEAVPGHPHVHMVLELQSAMTDDHLKSKWTISAITGAKISLGRVDVQAYNADLHGVLYLTKTLPSDKVEWGFNRRRPAEDRVTICATSRGMVRGS